MYLHYKLFPTIFDKEKCSCNKDEFKLFIKKKLYRYNQVDN